MFVPCTVIREKGDKISDIPHRGKRGGRLTGGVSAPNVSTQDVIRCLNCPGGGKEGGGRNMCGPRDWKGKRSTHQNVCLEITSLIATETAPDQDTKK